jgi:hypothetical protein
MHMTAEAAAEFRTQRAEARKRAASR